jgi:hypothetical protein
MLYALSNETKDERIPLLLLPENGEEILYIPDLAKIFQQSLDSGGTSLIPQNLLFGLARQLSAVTDRTDEVVEIAMCTSPDGFSIIARNSSEDIALRFMNALENSPWVSEKSNFWTSSSGKYICSSTRNFIFIHEKNYRPDLENIDAVPEFMRCLDRSGITSDAVYFKKDEKHQWFSIDLEFQRSHLLMNGFLPSLPIYFQSTSDDPGMPICSGADSIDTWYYNDCSQSYKGILHQWQSHNREEDFNRLISDVEVSCECSYSELFEGWCAGPIVTYVAENERAVVLRSCDRQSALQKFSAIADSNAFMGAWGSSILPMNKPWPASLLLGPTYSDSLRNIMIADDIIAFGENTNILNRLAREIDSGDVLPPPPGTLNPRNYMHVGASVVKEGTGLYGVLLAGEANLPFVWEKTSGFISSGGSKWITDSVIYFNAVISATDAGSSSTVRSDLWQAKLESPAIGEIHLALNHYTNAYEALVQDDRNQLYLVSDEGKIHWKIELDGPLVSGVQQIDVFRNGKLQMAFSTRSSVYVIDRNGKSLEGFPVRLKSPASGPLAVFDYDRDGNYRLLLPMEDGNIANFNKDGQAVKGWKSNKMSSPVVSVEHLRFGEKDYLLMRCNNGELHVLQRDGARAEVAPVKIPPFSQGSLSLHKAGDILTSGYIFSDPSGLITNITLNGKSTSLFKAKGSASWLSSQDMNSDGDPEILVLTKGEVCMHSIDSTLLWCNPCDIPPVILPSLDGEGKLLGCTFRGESYLIDSEGKVVNGSPFEGVSNPKMRRAASNRQTPIFYLSDPQTLSSRLAE